MDVCLGQYCTSNAGSVVLRWEWQAELIDDVMTFITKQQEVEKALFLSCSWVVTVSVRFNASSPTLHTLRHTHYLTLRHCDGIVSSSCVCLFKSTCTLRTFIWFMVQKTGLEIHNSGLTAVIYQVLQAYPCFNDTVKVFQIFTFCSNIRKYCSTVDAMDL